MQGTIGSGAYKTGAAGSAGTGSGINKSCIMEAEITGNRPIARDIYRLVMQCGDAGGMRTAFSASNPGQFINVYLRDKSMLLPRPVSICLADEERVTLVYRVVGKGTKELSAYKEGESLKISAPLGKGYDIGAVLRTLSDGVSDGLQSIERADLNTAGHAGKTVALVAGGLGVPPMLLLAKTIRSLLGNGARPRSGSRTDNGSRLNDGAGPERIRLISASGFQEEPFLIEELKEFCDEIHIATDSGTAGFHGNVLEMMETEGIKADYYLSCGPKPMLKALAEHCGRIKKPLQVSLEERMGCGYGACVGCACRIREKTESREISEEKKSAAGGETAGGEAIIRRKKVCTDGPVFFGDEVDWDD